MTKQTIWVWLVLIIFFWASFNFLLYGEKGIVFSLLTEFCFSFLIIGLFVGYVIGEWRGQKKK